MTFRLLAWRNYISLYSDFKYVQYWQSLMAALRSDLGRHLDMFLFDFFKSVCVVKVNFLDLQIRIN